MCMTHLCLVHHHHAKPLGTRAPALCPLPLQYHIRPANALDSGRPNLCLRRLRGQGASGLSALSWLPVNTKTGTTRQKPDNSRTTAGPVEFGRTPSPIGVPIDNKLTNTYDICPKQRGALKKVSLGQAGAYKNRISWAVGFRGTEKGQPGRGDAMPLPAKRLQKARKCSVSASPLANRKKGKSNSETSISAGRSPGAASGI